LGAARAYAGDGVLPAKTSILGVGISATSYSDVVSLCRAWVTQRRYAERAGAAPPEARQVFICTVHSVMTGVLDAHFRNLINSADVATPDGMPLVWALRSFGVDGQARVYGPTLMLRLCAQAVKSGHRIFLYGGRAGQLTALKARLQDRFPGLNICGTLAPPFRPLTADEDARDVAYIGSCAPDIVFVGLGLPKQERWIAGHAPRLPGTILVGVGAAFDFHSGRIRQAPAWMQNAGLEWLFRLLQEPRRLWRRYLLNPVFLVLWAAQRLHLATFPSAHPNDSAQGQW
jgi:N-acetylglucosaminyldiphosphoundecaprenol N-acetyl-beta-D-mannosaminyltransferase